jgi:SAM-dependent methyltransferase
MSLLMPPVLDNPPSAWMQRFLPNIPKNLGPVLDLACGSGRHTRLLIDAGYEVWAVDRDSSLLPPLEQLGARCFQIDLEAPAQPNENGVTLNWPFKAEQFAGVVVTNYLYRPLFAQLNACLKQQGVLIYETFATGNEAYGSPRNSDFLLRPGELLQQFLSDSGAGQKNHCIAYEQGYVDLPRPALLQRICLRRVSGDFAAATQAGILDRI